MNKLIPLMLAAGALWACSANTGQDTALRVEITWDAAVTSACFRVEARGASGVVRASAPLARPADKAKLVVALYQDDLGASVQVQARGFAMADCSGSAEVRSDPVTASFVAGRAEVVALHLRAVAGDGDGGVDGGVDAGVDAGFDAGVVDADGDASPAGVDCDDQDPARSPAFTEACGDGVDNDCDSAVDCADDACDAQACAALSVCVATVCKGPDELCADRVDNNGNGQVDCVEASCDTKGCDDANRCTTGEVCAGNGTCGGGAAVTCTAPRCFVSLGCDADAGCLTAPADAGVSCDDGDGCTVGDACDGTGQCLTTPRACPLPSECFANPRCVDDGGVGSCRFDLTVDAGCGAGNACRTGDRCLTDGGCGGGQDVTCAASSECFTANACNPTTGCSETPRTGQPCSTGTCDGSGQCVGTLAFAYTPSNVTVAEVEAVGNVGAWRPGCDVTLDTSGMAVSVAGPTGCVVVAPPSFVKAQGGGLPELAVVVVTSLDIPSGVTVRAVGTRPLVLAVRGSVTIAGTLDVSGVNVAHASGAGGETSCGASTGGDGISGAAVGDRTGGGGGGALGDDGGDGGDGVETSKGTKGVKQGADTQIPLRGGCRGGHGGDRSATADGLGNGGRAGGAVQVSAAGAVSVSGKVRAHGDGGLGGATRKGGGGGGSGGGILLEGQTIAVAPGARVVANGGGGGAGADTVQSAAPNGQAGQDTTARAAGAVGASWGASGGEGGAAVGTVGLAGADRPNSGGNAGGGGGGGGGAGRVRLNAVGGCTVSSTNTVISPARTGSGAGCQ